MIKRKALIFALLLSAGATASGAADRHAGYYYPEPQSEEIYSSTITVLPNASRRTRIGFTVGLNARQQKRNYAPAYHIFAKGSVGEKMIIVAAGEGQYSTLYRLRALLAALSAEARLSPLFAQARNPENLNFLDLAKMTGFTQITISDGDKMAHQIKLK